MNTASLENDLDLTAFRYIAGEMPAHEQAAFEERLAADQSARESVARAVRLSRAVASAAPETGSRQRPAAMPQRPQRRRLRTLASIAASAACVFLAAVLTWRAGLDRIRDADTGSHSGTSMPDADPETAGLSRMLALWSAAGSPEADAEAADAAAFGDADFASRDMGEVPASEVLIPDWMLAGVSLAKELEDQVTRPSAEEN
jgi:hypothetical protein